MGNINTKRATRHGRYKVGTCKLTVTVENEEKVRVHRAAIIRGFDDDSAFLRSVIHEAVWQIALTDEDLETLKEMRKNQEVL